MEQLSKTSILFVDDEPNILDGLKRMLRSMRKELNMYFAESGATALEVMQEHDCDIVISDMRMPSMDGAMLLKEVQKQYPGAIRIILTGQADEQSVMDTVGVAHQFIAKPCDPDELKDVIKKVGALHKLISNKEVKKLVSEVSSLPSLPSVYLELEKALKDPDSTVESLAAIIAKDVAMTAKILQLVNSAFFGLFKKVDSPERAISLLGFDTVKALVLGVEIFSKYTLTDSTSSIEDLWKHSMLVGMCAKKITSTITDDGEVVENSMIGGILHDIGKLIFVTQLKDKYLQSIDLATSKNITLYQAEKNMFQTTHSEVGAYLLGLWGLPCSLVTAVGFHHRLADLPTEHFSSALAVHVADTFVCELRPDSLVGEMMELDNANIEKVGCSQYLEDWKEMCREIVERAANE